MTLSKALAFISVTEAVPCTLWLSTEDLVFIKKIYFCLFGNANAVFNYKYYDFFSLVYFECFAAFCVLETFFMNEKAFKRIFFRYMYIYIYIFTLYRTNTCINRLL